MEIRMLDKKGQNISFVLRNVDAHIANALRRAILEEVPTIAIEDVEFRKNSSILYDEIVAHRLGLIPLKTNLKTYTLPEECKCKGEGCARCQVQLTLKTTKMGNICASDLKSKDPSVEPVYPEMVITKLLKGQALEFIATATLGKGKTHSKWSPGHVYYYNEAKITVNNDEKLLSQFKDKYPQLIFDKAGKVDRNLIVTPELIDACEGISKLVEVEKLPNNFVFVLESWGQLPPKIILQEAVQQLTAQLDKITELVKSGSG